MISGVCLCSESFQSQQEEIAAVRDPCDCCETVGSRNSNANAKILARKECYREREEGLQHSEVRLC